MIKRYYSIVYNIVKITSKTLRDYPRIFIPLSLRAMVSLGTISVLYVIPYYPFKKILGPLVVEFLGAKYLHYPNNFFIMPTVFTNIKNFLINPLFSSVMIAICCGMVYDYYLKREPGFWRNFNKAVRRFLQLFICMLFQVLVSYGLYKIIPVILQKVFHYTNINYYLFLFLPFFILVLIESLFVFCFIAIMTEKQNAIKALKRSFIYSLKLYPVVFFLVFIPRLLDFSGSIFLGLQSKMSAFLAPDITIAILVLIIIISIISDTLVFSLTTHLYALNHNEN